MDIGSAHSVNANNPAPNQHNERLERTETETDSTQTTGGTTQASSENAPTQRVQPVAETEDAQATNNSTPEPEAGSREAVGRFIDTVV